MRVLVRPPVESDLEELTAIDAAYAGEHGLETVMSAGALRFFGRSEHSFTAEGEGDQRALGFALAQALWTGDRPQVIVRRVAAGGRPEVASALLKAVVKSAYDSGVYDLSAQAPRTDQLLLDALAQEEFAPDPQLTLVRILGSRGADAAQRVEAAARG